MKTLLCLLTFLAITASSASAAGYLKIGDIKGEAQRIGYEDWIEISGLELDIAHDSGTSVGRSRARSQAMVEPIGVYKALDKSSPYLILATLQGRSFDEVEIHFTRESERGSFAFLKYTFSNVSIVSYGTTAEDSEKPTETFSINFERIKVVYIEQGNDGSAGDEHEITYDIAAGV